MVELAAENRVRVLAVLGTRPEAIKLAPVIQALLSRAAGRGGQRLTVRVCATGQHREMLDQVLRLFDIRPEYDLNVMADSRTPTQVAAAVLAGLEPILGKEKPDWVLVQGDTITAAAAALAAFLSHARVGHVEAGLRTFDKWQPFPEEINRRIAGVIADLHFAPTGTARDNLLREGVPAAQILVTGNPVIDALHRVAAQPFDLGSLDLPPEALPNSGRRVILVTAHRRENLGAPLENICLALRDLAGHYGERVHIIYPVHMNPDVWGPVHRMLGAVSNITLTPPLEYLPLVRMIERSYLVLTDSGGIQEEAPGLGRPVLVLRDVTERPEAVEAGTVRLVGTDRERIVAEAGRLLDDESAYLRMARAVNPYGDGRAAERIAGALMGEKVAPLSAPEKVHSAHLNTGI